MSLQEILALNQLRCKIATVRAMETWSPGPTTYGDTCPHCNSANYGKYSVEQGTQRYRCRDCKRRFNERPVFTCDCVEPGQIPRCHDCPKFEEFLKSFKSQADDLRMLNRAELETLCKQLSIQSNTA